MNSGGDKKLQYLQYCMHRINMLRHYQITPVVVFDGASIPCKSGNEQERHSKRKANLELAMSKFKEGDAAAASELFQNVRLMYQTDNKLWGYNALKYFTTIVAVCTRTAYSVKDGLKWKIIAWVCSAVAAIFCTYWDIVIDRGLLQRNSTNRWLRNKLVIPHKSGSCAQYANTQGEELREVIGASLYIECSAKTQQNLKGVFDAAIEVGLHSPNQKKKKISMAQKECSVL